VRALFHFVLLLGSLVSAGGGAAGSSPDPRPLPSGSPTVSMADPRLRAAEEAYRKGDYEGAAKHWKAVLADHPWDGRLEYDLGNCAYRRGRYAEALWRYERARRRLGERTELLFNEALCLRRLGRAGDPEPSLPSRLRTFLREALPVHWFRLALGLQAAALLLALLARPWKTRRLRAALALCVFLAAGYAFHRAATLEEGREVGAVILAREAPLRAEPRESLEPIARLSRGVRAVLVERGPRWVRIRIGDRSGWIPLSLCGLY